MLLVQWYVFIVVSKALELPEIRGHLKIPEYKYYHANGPVMWVFGI